MLDPLWLKAVVKVLVLPPTGLLLIAVLGLAVHARAPRTGRALTATGVLALLVLSMPIVADFLGEFLDTAGPFDLRRAKEAQAIVIIGGGVRHDAPEFGGDTLSSLTLERVRYGARVARLTGLPVLVAGGRVLRGKPEAALMRASLEGEFGVPVRWAEARSRTTHENAVYSAEMLKRDGVLRVVLVAHDFDMRRAIAEFEAAGLAVIGAPTGTYGGTESTLIDFLPGMAGLHHSYYVCYELLANLVRVVARGG